MMTFIFKNNFSTTSRGHNENKTWKLSSVDPVIPFPEQKLSFESGKTYRQQYNRYLLSITKLSIYFINICFPPFWGLFVHLFLAAYQPQMKPVPPAVKAWTLNHWTTRDLGHGLEDLLEGMLAQPGLERFQSV